MDGNAAPTAFGAARAALEQAGLKATHQRLAILHALWGGHDHAPQHPATDAVAGDATTAPTSPTTALLHPSGHRTAEDLFTDLRTQYPSLSLGTVYRTLESFAEAGLVRKLPGALDGPARFDADVRPHHHLVDPERGLLHDLHDPELDALLADYFTRKPIAGFYPHQLQLTVIGRSQH